MIEPIRIPIAEDCNSTFYLKDNNLRFESYYFDWLVLSPKIACELIKKDFDNFFVKDNLKVIGLSEDNQFKKAEIYVQDVVNDIFYLHHFNNLELDYEPLKKKFERKIDRMVKHFKDNRSIEFYFKPTKYAHWKKMSKQKWGVSEMESEFLDLKKFLLEKYSYRNESEIKLILL